MKSSDLIEQTIDLAHLPPPEARRLLTAIFDAIATALETGRPIDLAELTGGRIDFGLRYGAGSAEEAMPSPAMPDFDDPASPGSLAFGPHGGGTDPDQ